MGSYLKEWFRPRLISFWTRIPAWCRLAGKSCYRSLREFLFLVVFSFMPVWLGALFHFLSTESISNYLNGYLYNGEALLLSATTVGPLMFILMNSEDGDANRVKGFPLKWLYCLLVVAICVIAAALVGFKSAPSVTLPSSPSAMWSLSLITSVFSVLLWFAIVTTNSVRENGAADIMRQDEQDYLQQYGVK